MSFSDSDDDILSTKVKSFNIAPEDRKHMSMVRDDFVRADLDDVSTELIAWMEKMIGHPLGSDLISVIENGVILCEIVEKYIPNARLSTFHRNAEPNTFQARENIQFFGIACRSMGIRKADILTSVHIQHHDLKPIITALCIFARVGVTMGLMDVDGNHLKSMMNQESIIQATEEAQQENMNDILAIEEHQRQILQTIERNKEKKRMNNIVIIKEEDELVEEPPTEPVPSQPTVQPESSSLPTEEPPTESAPSQPTAQPDPAAEAPSAPEQPTTDTPTNYDLPTQLPVEIRQRHRCCFWCCYRADDVLEQE